MLIDAGLNYVTDVSMSSAGGLSYAEAARPAGTCVPAHVHTEESAS